jgi:uncharacterized DUF497 family protein
VGIIIGYEVVGFNWDKGNREKCTKHGLRLVDIEDFFRRQVMILTDKAHSRSETRFIAVGRAANGRPMLVGFTFRTVSGALLLRPISARYMHKKEVLRCEKATS